MARLGGPVAALVGAAALWGLATVGTKYALGRHGHGFGAVTLLTVELVAATAVLWTALLVRGRGRCRAASLPWRTAAPLGLLEPGLAYLADTVGLSRTSAANGAVVQGLEASFVAVLAWVFLRERIDRRLCVAIGLGLAGLLQLEQIGRGFGALSGVGLGDLAVAGGTLSAAAYTVVARRIGVGSDSLALTTCQFTWASAGVVPVAAVTWGSGGEGLPTDVPATFWAAAVLVGVAGFAASFLIYNRAITRVEARAAAVVLNLIPAFGLVGAVVWLGESLTAARIAGAALIAASVVLFTRFGTDGPDTGPGPAAHPPVPTPAAPSAPIERALLCSRP